MTPKHPYQAYAAATQTVAKTKQIILLYDGAIRFLQQAREAIREKRIEDRYHLLLKVSDIVMGLQGCLDFEQGGDIARILYHFYASIDRRVFTIHHSNSIETCDELIAELKQMRDAWQDIDKTSPGPAPVVPAPRAAEPAAKPFDPGAPISA